MFLDQHFRKILFIIFSVSYILCSSIVPTYVLLLWGLSYCYSNLIHKFDLVDIWLSKSGDSIYPLFVEDYEGIFWLYLLGGPQLGYCGVWEIIVGLYLKFSSLPGLYNFKTTTINPLIFTIKFLILVSTLIFIRGGVPRYRYDFLTKLGWIKFLSLVISVLVSSVLLVYLF